MNITSGIIPLAGLAVGIWCGRPAPQAPTSTTTPIVAAESSRNSTQSEQTQASANTSGGRLLAVYEKLRNASVDTLKEVLQAAADNPDPYQRRVVREMAFRLWIAQDKKGALEFAIRYDGGRAIGQFMLYLGKTAPEGCVAFLRENIPATVSEKIRAQNIHSAVGVNARYDPKRFLELMKDPENAAVAEAGDYVIAMRHLARRDPAAALAAWAELPAKFTGTTTVMEMMTSAAAADPEASLKWALEDKGLSPAGRNNALRGWICGLAQTDPQRAARELTERGTPNWGAFYAETYIVDAIAKQDPTAAAQKAAAMASPGERWDNALDAVLSGVSSSSASQLLAVLEPFYQADAADIAAGKLKPEDSGASALDTTLEKWQSPQAKADWQELLGKPASAGRDFLLAKLGSTIVRDDPATVVAAAAALPAGDLKNSLNNQSADRFLENRDAASLQTLLPQLSPEKAREITNNMIGNLVNENRPAAEQLLQQLPAGALQKEAYSTFTRELAASNPGAAISWIQTQQAAQQPQLQYLATKVWAESDAYSASTWIATQPAGDPRDAAVCGLIDNIITAEPDSAFVWAGSLQNEKLRQRALTTVIMNWSRDNRSAALDALEQSSLSPEDRAQLVQKLTATQP